MGTHYPHYGMGTHDPKPRPTGLQRTHKKQLKKKKKSKKKEKKKRELLIIYPKSTTIVINHQVGKPAEFISNSIAPNPFHFLTLAYLLSNSERLTFLHNFMFALQLLGEKLIKVCFFWLF